jgi:hypothetical protein
MRVAQFIRTHPDEIESEWEKFAKAISSFAPDLNVSALRDHLREILLAMADDGEPAKPGRASRKERRQKDSARRKLPAMSFRRGHLALLTPAWCHPV